MIRHTLAALALWLLMTAPLLAASTDAMPVPKKNTAYRVLFYICDADGDPVTSGSALDCKLSKDGASFTAAGGTETEIGEGWYYCDLTAAEMNYDCVIAVLDTATAGAKQANVVLFPTEATDIPVDVTALSGDTTAADQCESVFDNTGYAMTNSTIGAVNSVAADGITASSIAAGAITSSEAPNLDAAVTTRSSHSAGDVWAIDATTQQTQGTFGQVLGDSAADTDSVWSLCNTNLTATVGSRSSHSAADVWTEATRDITGGTIDTVAAGGITNTSFGAGAIDANAIAAGAIGESELAGDCITAAEIAAGAITSSEAPNLDAAVTTRSSHSAGDVWAIDATTQQTQGTFGQAVGDPGVDTSTIWGLCDTNLTATVGSRSSHSAADVWTEATRDITGGTIDTMAAGGITNTSFGAGAIDANAIAADAIGSSELATTAVDEIADGNWDEVLSGHTTADTGGKVLNMLTQDAVTLSTDVELDSILGQLLDAGGTWSYDRTADSLEVISQGASAASIADAVWDEDIVAAHGGSDAAGLILSNLTHRSVTLSTDVDIDSVIGQTLDDGTPWSYLRSTDSLEASGGAGPSAGAIADAVWDEDIVAAHGGSDAAGLIVSNLTHRSVTLSTDVVIDSVFGQTLDNGTPWSYSATTDSQEAIADGGVADWTTSEKNEIRFRLSMNGTQSDPAVSTGYCLTDVVRISTDASAANNLESMLDSTGATLTLDQLRINSTAAGGAVDIDNTIGPGLSVRSSGSMGAEIVSTTPPSGAAGLVITGSDAGDGLAITAGSSGVGLEISAAGSHAIRASSTGGNGDGLRLSGNGTGEGLYAIGGASGRGAEFSGGATAGHGLVCTGTGTGGRGISATSGTGGHGIYAEGTDTGEGIHAQGGDTGHGFQANGGATSGSGMHLLGSGANNGLYALGGATGSGARFSGGATAGHGLHVDGSGAAEGLFADGGTSGNGIEAIGYGGAYDIVADIQGNLSGSIGSVAADGITAGSIAAGAITSSEAPNLDAAITSRSSHAAADIWTVGTREITGGTIDTIGSGAITTGSFGAAAIDAAAIAAGAITSSEAPNLDAAISTRSSHAAADIWTVGTRTLTGVTAANITQIGGNATAATVMQNMYLAATVSGSVVDASPSATVFDTDLVEASDDHYNAAYCVFVSGALSGQSRKIKDYDGTGKTLTMDAGFTEAPGNGDNFVILGRSE